MERKRGKAIWAARTACKLSQQELGDRLGIRAQTVRRWEWEDTLPSRSKCVALVAAISAVNAEAGQKLAQALAAELDGAATDAEAAQALATSSSIPTSEAPALDLAIFKIADDLNATPRRVRNSVLELLKFMRAANLSIEAVLQQLEDRVASSQLN